MKRILCLFVASCLFSKINGMNSNSFVFEHYHIDRTHDILYFKFNLSHNVYDLRENGISVSQASCKEGKYCAILQAKNLETNKFFIMSLKGDPAKNKYDDLVRLKNKLAKESKVE